MAKPIPTPFQLYEFETEQEAQQAKVLTEGNLYSIRNKLALAMIERSHLAYDPELPITAFVQREAHLKGEIDTYQQILDDHDSVVGVSRELTVRE